MRPKSQQGFTLLELIVVAVIIGLLAAIAIPQFASYRDKATRAGIFSDCRSLYRSFIVFYLEQDEYPYKDAYADEPAMQFILNTFAPLTLSSYMGGTPFDLNMPRFLDNFEGNKAEAYDSPDDTIGANQEFYVVMAWKNDPAIKFIVAQADDVKYADGTDVANGDWIDGVFISTGGNLIGK